MITIATATPITPRKIIKMALAAASGAGGMLADRLGDLAGSSLPYLPQRVCRPEVFNDLLRTGAVRPWPRPPAVTAITFNKTAS